MCSPYSPCRTTTCPLEYHWPRPLLMRGFLAAIAPGAHCVAGDQVPAQHRWKLGMKAPRQHFPVRRAAREQVPQHGAHVPPSCLPALLVCGHAQDSAPQETQLLDQAAHRENHLGDGIVVVDALARRPEMPTEILIRDAMMNHCLCRRLGDTISRTDAVLVQARHARVADPDDSVSVL